MSTTLDPVHPSLVRVSLDDSAVLSWPVTFVIPEYGEIDLIATFNEESRQERLPLFDGIVGDFFLLVESLVDFFLLVELLARDFFLPVESLVRVLFLLVESVMRLILIG